MKSRSRIALLIVLLFILGTGSIAAYQSLSKTIAIVDDGKVTQYETVDVYVRELLESQGINLAEKDTVSPGLETALESGMKITITRWMPSVSLTVNGETTKFDSKAKTVSELLTDKKIELPEGSSVEPAGTTSITDNIQIVVKTKKLETKVVEESIPFKTQVKNSTDLGPNEEKVVQEGQNGAKQKTMEIVHFGGEVIKETVKEEVILKEAQNKVVLKGIKNVIVDETSGKNYEYTKTMTLNATAYTDIEGDRWSGITASGMKTFVGMVAVDPRVIPLGTKLYVEDYGVAVAGDTGGAIKGNKIDLFFNTNSEVYNFGRRNKKIYILKDQSLDVRTERASN